ncbi:S1 family peptidase [Actinoplanes sp. CA-142083]|uniref:S1 family peptidase n=1 Tax=Actinoplanes sp. CA-142083 TaxID=3239903 RepID=UPI003D93981D
MRLRRVLALGAAVLATATGIVAGPAPAQAVAATTLASTIALSNCSASLVRYPSSVSSDRAMMLTNGHCYEGGFLSAGQVLQNRTSSRSGSLLNASGRAVATVRADRVLYATMTGTDVTLYRLTSTYATLSSRYAATALTISASHPAAGAGIAIPSSYWKRIWNCKIDSFVGTLREDVWTWRDSIRYDVNCDTIHGTSGSPIVDASSGQIVGINNTGNDDGQMCTLNNPCEVDANGTTHAYQGQSYGEQTYWFTTCLTSSRTIDLSISGCLLTKPAS